MMLDFEYDEIDDCLSIEGMKYSGELFRQWSKDGMPLQGIFRIVGRDDGVFTVDDLTDQLPLPGSRHFGRKVIAVEDTYPLVHGQGEGGEVVAIVMIPASYLDKPITVLTLEREEADD